jgi:hypothetical protein
MNFKGLFLGLLCVSTTFCLDFDKVILWGHKLHSHTHSYIHAAFAHAFEHLGYPVYWVDNRDDVSKINFNKAPFITEGQVDQKIPLVDSAYYILHNCTMKKYEELFRKKRCIVLQVYTHDCDSRPLETLDDCILCNVEQQIIYMPWATDLLPHEIEAQKAKVRLHALDQTKQAYFIGSVSQGAFGNRPEIDAFSKACFSDHVAFQSMMGTSFDKNRDLICNAYMAPAIQGRWQCKQGYIPCRIFKNISYGQPGITNSALVYKLFKNKIVYNSDTK